MEKLKSHYEKVFFSVMKFLRGIYRSNEGEGMSSDKICKTVHLSLQGWRKRPLYYWECDRPAEIEYSRQRKKVLLLSHDLELGGPLTIMYFYQRGRKIFR